MIKYFNIIFLIILAIVFANKQVFSQEDIPQYIFSKTYKTNSPYVIRYDDLDNILSGVTLNIGRSLHTHAQNRVQQTGTKFRRGNQKSTWLESNRIL